MLKLFFVIATFMTLAQSQIAVEWICKDTNSMGNCTTIPKLTDLLQIISDNSDNYEFTDSHYCPFSIVERYAKCMKSYVDSCKPYMVDEVQNIFLNYMPKIEDAETLCTKGRAYKKEFREHSTCTKAFLTADDDWEQYLQIIIWKYGQSIDDMDAIQRCKMVSIFWQVTSTNIRKKCGAKTEKFSRQLLSNMWPLTLYTKLCSQVAAAGP
ncbi:uncharacterized protein LOC111034804 [Myzus persicae]|uniref:uncharacterized protein LOC111034804 n=1 Tax=Myzus persicae TaxID=13164 RepID=UPI000B935263|nr:uncharacterized protein LOC111034804 [Myzus persicae]